MKFQVKAVRLGEANVSIHEIDARDAREAESAMQLGGYVPLSVSQLRDKRPQPRRDAFPLFCREIRTLIRAGMTVVEATDTLATRGISGRRDHNLAKGLLSRLQQGQALSTALQGLDGTPPVLIAAVRAGERTSDLVAALDDYLRFDDLVEELRRKVVSAAIYPLLVSALGLGISFFLLVVVIPSFARMYENLRGRGSGVTALMIQFSSFVSANQTAFIAGSLLAICLLAYWVTSGWATKGVKWFISHVPFLRIRVEDFHLAMIYQALALLTKGGYPFVEAINVASSAALSPRLSAAVSNAGQKITRGGSVAEALYSEKLCDEVGHRLMAAAERNGDFYLAANVVSDIHSQRFELFVDRLTRVVEPVLLMLVAVMVGSIVVAMYLPVFDMATRLR
ncbi:MAG: type II secretion system F family protein [Ramlibacter sp.]|nr:type II secretion system F family protein [Ramlibacter sp.]